MWLKAFLIALGAFAVGLVATVLVSKSHLDRENARQVDELLAHSGAESDRVFRLEDLVRLPEPVQRYLAHVLTEGQPYARTVRLRQRGEFRVGDATAPWKPFNATQHFTVDPAVRDRQNELAAKPDGLILDGVWAFTHTGGPPGLEITEVEVIPPAQRARQPDAAD